MNNDELLYYQRQRNNLRRQWQRGRDPAIRFAVNELNKIIQNKIQLIKNANWSKYLSSLDTNCQNLWKTTKIIKNKVKFTPPFKLNGQTIVSDVEKANVLASCFNESHQLTNFPTTSHNESLVNNSITTLHLIDSGQIKLIKPCEIVSILKNLKTAKAPGNDQIPNIILKNLPSKIIVYLVFIFNACLKTSYFPSQWKIANVISIPKATKDLSNPYNYRPISLLSTLSKVFERLVLQRINEHISRYNCIPNSQFGFRSQHSTTHQLVRVTNTIKNGFNNQLSTGIILFDCEKAFDTVWHEGLLHKLLLLNFPIYLIKIIQSFLTNRKFQVSFKQYKSNIHNIPAGVPQGSCISPTLYNLFISDLPIHLNCETALFADDLAIYCSAIDPAEIIVNLQQYSDEIIKYYQSWRLKLNYNKTQSAFFTKRRARRYLPDQDIVVNNININWSNSVKYLGVTLDPSLTFKTHIQNTADKINNCIRTYYPFISRSSKLSNRNKLIIYKVVFQSIILYASPVFYSCAKTHKLKLQILQNKTLKIIEKLPTHFSTSKLHSQTSVKLISEAINERSASFFQRCRNSTINYINELAP